MIATVRRTLATRRGAVVVAAAAAAYAVLYLWLARALVVDPTAHFSRFVSIPSAQVAPGFGPRYLTDVFNPAFVVYLGDAVALAVPVPVLAAALVLGLLVGANMALAVEAIATRPPGCGIARPWWAIGALPGFLAGFACCAPALLLVVGAGFASSLVAVAPFAAPASAAALVGGLVWNTRRLDPSRR